MFFLKVLFSLGLFLLLALFCNNNISLGSMDAVFRLCSGCAQAVHSFGSRQLKNACKMRVSREKSIVMLISTETISNPSMVH